MNWLRVLVVATLLAGGVGCKSAGIPDNARTTVLSFPDLDCGDCGEEMARLLIEAEGVYKSGFDKRRVELTVVADPGIDALRLAERLRPEEEKWHLVEGAGKGAYLPWKTPPQDADVVIVATDGEDVPSLEPHLVAGKITIVDFSAKWCDPCRELDEHVLALMEKRNDIAYRKLDVGDWDTPLGERYLKDVKALPYVIVFDTQTQRVDAIDGLDLARFDRAIQKAGTSAP